MCKADPRASNSFRMKCEMPRDLKEWLGCKVYGEDVSQRLLERVCINLGLTSIFR